MMVLQLQRLHDAIQNFVIMPAIFVMTYLIFVKVYAVFVTMYSVFVMTYLVFVTWYSVFVMTYAVFVMTYTVFVIIHSFFEYVLALLCVLRRRTFMGAPSVTCRASSRGRGSSRLRSPALPQFGGRHWQFRAFAWLFRRRASVFFRKSVIGLYGRIRVSASTYLFVRQAPQVRNSSRT